MTTKPRTVQETQAQILDALVHGDEAVDAALQAGAQAIRRLAALLEAVPHQPETVGQLRDKVRIAFRREWSARYPPALKRQVEEDALDALIAAASREAVPQVEAAFIAGYMAIEDERNGWQFALLDQDREDAGHAFNAYQKQTEAAHGRISAVITGRDISDHRPHTGANSGHPTETQVVEAVPRLEDQEKKDDARSDQPQLRAPHGDDRGGSR